MPSRISNNSLRASATIFAGRSFFGRDSLKPRLRLVQMIQRPLQVGDRERRVREVLPASNATQGAGQLGPRGLKLKDELLQILVRGLIQAQVIGLLPEPHRALEAAMLQRMAEVAVCGANPVNAFAVRIRLGLRFVQRLPHRRIHFLDVPLFFLGLFLRQLAFPAHFFGDLFLRFVRVAVLVQQLHVFVRARVALLQELLIIVLVPFCLGVFLSALMLLDGLGELLHEIIHAGGGLVRALRFFRRASAAIPARKWSVHSPRFRSTTRPLASLNHSR